MLVYIFYIFLPGQKALTFKQLPSERWELLTKIAAPKCQLYVPWKWKATLHDIICP